jgi:hypothetical protein
MKLENLQHRNNLIYMYYEILGLRQKEIGSIFGLAEKTVKLIIGKVRRERNEPRKI